MTNNKTNNILPTPENTVFFVLWTDNYEGPKYAKIIPSTKEFYNYLSAQMFNIDPIRDDLYSADLNISEYFDTYEEAVEFVKEL